MIDPKNITNYELNRRQLQEYMIFWIAVAGKKASSIAPRIDGVFKEGYQILSHRGPLTPFKIIKDLGRLHLANLLREHGIGCYNLKAETMFFLANSGLDLKTCTRDELVSIKGISFKTANCFIMHSRLNARCAAFDTHLLKFMKAMGLSVPDQPPQSLKQHERLEKHFLDICDQTGFIPADLDLIIWRLYAYHPSHVNKFTKAIKRKINI